MRILVADVGSGTTDILIYDTSLVMENCPKLVIPSQTQQVAAAIREATREKRPVIFKGVTMGGGPSGAALRSHLKAGLSFFASPAAALTFHDDLDRVASWGVTIQDEPAASVPAGSIVVKSGDIDLPRLAGALRRLGIEDSFDGAAIAVQDHGFSPGASNRRRRFSLWRELLKEDSSLTNLAWEAGDIPVPYSRMRAVASLLLSGLPRVVVMDTGPAAVLGAALAAGTKGLHLIVNVGNGHTLAAIVEDGRLAGIFEHHTGMLGREKLEELIRQFAAGGLSNEEVFNEGGHGCIPPSAGFDLKFFGPLQATGPRRDILRNGSLRLEFAAPFGDMMLTGCFGLIDSYRRLAGESA